MTDELVHLELDRAVATLTLDSPANRNAMSRALIDQLNGHLDSVLGDAQIRAVVITATGPAFCAGADLRDGAGVATRAGADLFLRLMTAPKVVVARIAGHVRAGGLGFVAAADIALAAEGATFALPEVRLGVVPAIVAVALARRMDGRSLSRFALTGEVFGARAAAAAGLLTAAVPPAELEATCEEVLAGIRLGSPIAIARTKQILSEVGGWSLSSGFEQATELSTRMFASEEAREGMAAFREKRRPTWAI